MSPSALLPTSQAALKKRCLLYQRSDSHVDPTAVRYYHFPVTFSRLSPFPPKHLRRDSNAGTVKKRFGDLTLLFGLAAGLLVVVISSTAVINVLESPVFESGKEWGRSLTLYYHKRASSGSIDQRHGCHQLLYSSASGHRFSPLCARIGYILQCNGFTQES
jgi:hypothetical protein